MRNLIVCCDGTWNTPDQKHDGVPVPTNVVRLFSRGACTARSLSGMITSCGLLDLRGLPDKDVWHRVAQAMKAYRKKKPPSWAGRWKLHGKGTPRRVTILFLGVWDTVGALGVSQRSGNPQSDRPLQEARVPRHDAE